jgi:predicted nucleic acid-binding protein
VIHLDTSFLVRALAAGSVQDRVLRAWLADGEEIGISAVCWAEFLCGPVRATEVELVARVVGEPSPFDAVDAAAAARLFNLSGRRRGTFVDCMVAAIALRARARLATANAADFGRFTSAGLEVVSATANR